MHRRSLAIFLKEPLPGAVKTRLARDIGAAAASSWYRRQCKALIRRICYDPRWDSYLAVSPDASGLASRVWPQHIPRIPQGGGDLGARMLRVFGMLPPGPAAIIGSDIPGVTASRVLSAFNLLGRHDAVFGPCVDGGYWLVGMKRLQRSSPRLFEGVRWSSCSALQDSVESFRRARIGFAETLRDVDTFDDLRECRMGERAR